jgi:GT2 family glycosyltransferase
MRALSNILAEAAGEIKENTLLIECLEDLEARLLQIENSRFIKLVRFPGRIAHDWRGHLGQLLLRSSLHDLYLRVRRPAAFQQVYRAWVRQEETATPSIAWFQQRAAAFQRRPLCSILLPVCDPRREWLEAAVESVRQQSYAEWQLCICDDASTAAWLPGVLETAASADSRIRFVRAENRLGIAGALNRAAQIATGEYLGFLDHDDILPIYALHYIVASLQRGDADLIYTDEDRLDHALRRVEPVFKPAWSPDLLLSCMYLGHFLVVKRCRFEAAGAFRPEMDGSQDHDLALRLTDEPVVVRHIPRVLYHWRKHSGSTASRSSAKPYAQPAGRRALEDTLHRRGITASVENGLRPNTYHLRRSPEGAGMATLVICSRRENLARRCLRAIERLTDYQDYEIILVQHAVKMRLNHARCRTLYYDGPFNFAHMNNLGAGEANGRWVIFLNDDVMPLDRGWLTELACHIARPDVGVVGARLLYPSGAIQHAGIVTGMADGTGHLHRHTFGSAFWNWSDLTRNVSAVTGACMALRKHVFAELGGFDENFPVNFNDVDLCLRARKQGYEVIYEPAAALRHDECQTRRRGVGWRERRRWREKWPQLQPGGDPFSSPHLHLEREDASLRLDEPFSPEDNAR